MHFFSRYRYIWKFPKEQELAYDEFVKPSNLVSLRLVTFITLFGMSLFLLIDSFRNVDFTIVILARAGALLGALLVMASSFKKDVSIGAIRVGAIIITLLNLSVSLVTAKFAGMPSYYLTNLLFLIFVLVVTASGLSFRYALLLNTICLLIFLIFSLTIKQDAFYFSQYPHLFSIFLYIHIVGLVLESRRRLNFLQFSDLKKQKKMVEDLNQQKNKIISILSHDVAAPLNSLSGLLHLQATGKIDETELRSFLNEVGDQLHNVTDLLYGLVRWSRSQMDGFVSEKKLVNVTQHLEDILRLFQPTAAEKVLNLKLTFAGSTMSYVDEDMIRIAIRNLISNAIKFAPVGTDIDVACFQRSDNRLMIQVTNQGDSFPAHLKEKLFTYQMPSSEGTGGEKGTGLGLAMAAFFVRFNGGNIFLESSAHNRTITFSIELPGTSSSVIEDQAGLVTSNLSR